MPFSPSRLRSLKTIASFRRRWRGSMPATPPVWHGVLRSIRRSCHMMRPTIPISGRVGPTCAISGIACCDIWQANLDQIVPSGVILAADDMPPSIFLATDWRDGGLVLRRGSPSSHVAILARSRGVPMIVGVDVDELEDGSDALLDADAGLLIVHPDTNMREGFDQRRAEQSKAGQAAGSFSGPALTATGELVRVMINVTGLAELERSRSCRCRRDRPDADRVSVSGPGKASNRGRAISDLQAHGGMGCRKARYDPHP